MDEAYLGGVRWLPRGAGGAERGGEGYGADDISSDVEVVKCVVVGDTGVGKTRLVCSRACGTQYSMQQLVQTHIPTVWAIDQYRKNPKVLLNSWYDIDGINVSLRLWDTFGDHDKDRRFAYDRADVVLVCFSVAHPRSLKSIQSYWYREIQRLCPSAPIVMCACQIDLRYLYRDPKYKALEKGPFFRVITEGDILLPEAGRTVAKSVGALYYETSVLEKFGIDELFTNVVRAALVAKRERHFWNALGSLKRVGRPRPQAPHLFPRPNPPQITCPTVERSGQESGRKLWENIDPLHDVVFVVCGMEILAHRVCLVIACSAFDSMFLYEEEDKSDHSHCDTATSLTGVTNEALSVDSDVLSESNSGLNLSASTLPPLAKFPFLFPSIGKENSSHGLVYRVTVNDSVSVSAFRALLYYLYVGECPLGLTPDKLMEVRRLAEVLGVQDLIETVINIQNREEFMNISVQSEFYRRREKRLNEMVLRNGVLADVEFKLDDGVVSAHKLLLVSHCEVMSSMFTGQFTERSAKMVDFPGVSCEAFSALQEYLYTGSIPSDLSCVSCLELLMLANRLCQPDLVKLLEKRVVEGFVYAEKMGQSVVDDVLMALEISQIHNGPQLAQWCLWYLCVSYTNLQKTHPKVLRNLRPDNLIHITFNRWPPAWYYKELDIYEKTLLEEQRERRHYVRKRSDTSSGSNSINEETRTGRGCFGFCSSRSRAHGIQRESTAIIPIAAVN